MLPKSYRLKQKRDFNRVYRRGANFRQSFFNFRFLDNALSHARIGIVIPLKISKKSTQRNRIKRLIAESFKKNKLILNHPKDIVITISRLPSNEKEILQIPTIISKYLLK